MFDQQPRRGGAPDRSCSLTVVPGCLWERGRRGCLCFLGKSPVVVPRCLLRGSFPKSSAVSISPQGVMGRLAARAVYLVSDLMRKAKFLEFWQLGGKFLQFFQPGSVPLHAGTQRAPSRPSSPRNFPPPVPCQVISAGGRRLQSPQSVDTCCPQAPPSPTRTSWTS